MAKRGKCPALFDCDKQAGLPVLPILGARNDISKRDLVKLHKTSAVKLDNLQELFRTCKKALQNSKKGVIL